LRPASTLALALALAACGSGNGSNGPSRAQHATISLPADDALHASAPLEWLYWTGHLHTDTGRWFGFEEVFFNEAVGSMAHVAVTDVDPATFEFAVSVSARALHASANGFDLALAGQTAAGGGGNDTLHGATATHTLDLALTTSEPAVLQFGNGYTDFVTGGNTYYYSRERLTAAGTVAVGGEVLAVTGTAWFDHQWGNLANVGVLGWEWFALQLDDDREVMVFQLYDAAGRVAQVAGTYDDHGNVTVLAAGDITVTAQGTWTSPHTGCSYSSGWTLGVLGQSYTVTPVLLDQELHATGPMYWEGAATVTGDATGRAYVELTTCM